MPGGDKPTMKWDSSDRAVCFELFRRKIEMYFLVNDVPDEKKVPTILLSMGDEGINMFDKWRLSEEEKRNPQTVLNEFEKIFNAGRNWRLERYELQHLRQSESETIDDFVMRCQHQAARCKFSQAEVEERIIEQIILGIKLIEAKKELLNEDVLTLSDAVNKVRVHESSIGYLKKMSTFSGDMANVDAITRSCRKCGIGHGEERCPAEQAKCHKCGKTGHYARVCNSRQARQRSPSKQRFTRRAPRRRGQSQYRKRDPSRNETTRQVDDVSEVNYLENDFNKFVFSITSTTGKVDAVKETIQANLIIKLEHHPQSRATLLTKVDTGSDPDILPRSTFGKMYPEKVDEYGLPKAGTLAPANHVTLTAYNGTTINQYGTFEIPVKYDENSEFQNIKFFIADTPGPAILGLSTSIKLKLISVNCGTKVMSVNEMTGDTSVNGTPTIVELKKKHPDRFDRIGRFPGTYRIIIDPLVPPVIHASRKYAIHLKDKIRDELKSMVDKEVIAKIDSGTPTEWVSSLTFSEKADGSLRVCLDPKDLNKAIKRTYHKTPTLDEITHQFNGASVFSKLDAKAGYWSIVLDEPSSWLTAFNTPYGRYRFLRLPFGLNVSQDIFQARMDEILEKCPGCIGIADDISVFGKNVDEHNERLQNLIRVASEYGLVFNSSKCLIGRTEIPFFGMIYNRNGVNPDPARINAIKKLTPPQNKGELREFLGIANYMAPFVANLSAQTSILRGLLSEDSVYDWNQTYEKCFQTVKSLICEATTLNYFNPELPSVIQVDASLKGLGAVLLQNSKPIYFASKSLSQTEQRYANIEREMLAVVFGIERFHTYIYGKKFTLETDHKPLLMITQKNIAKAPPRMQRLLLRIQGYQMELVYKPGAGMFLSDGLSRLINPTRADPEIKLDIRVHFACSETTQPTLLQETNLDPVLSPLKELIITGWPESVGKVSRPLRQYYSLRDLLSVHDGIVLKGQQIVIPSSMKKDILLKLHEGHLGIEKTRLLARDHVYWTGINKDIENFINRCTTCQENSRSNNKEPLLPLEVPSRPWQRVCTDLFQYKGDNYLLLSDPYSKFPFARYLKNNTTSSDVQQALMSIFCEHGFPAEIMSDNGPQFHCSSFKTFCKRHNIKHVSSSPRYPQSNGYIERCVQTVKRLLTKSIESDTSFDQALYMFRITPTSSRIPSPAELLSGRKFRSKLPTRVLPPHCDDTRDELLARQETQKQYYDRCAKNELPELYTGQYVRVQNENHSWTPARVIRKLDEPRSYEILLSNGSRLRRNRRFLREIDPEELQTLRNKASLLNNQNSSNNISSKKRVTFSETCEREESEPKKPLKIADSSDPQSTTNIEHSTPKSISETHPRTRSGRIVKPPARLDL